MASLVGKSSWAVPQDRPSERGSQRHLECFFCFFLQRRKGPRICRHAESCGMFLSMFLYSHEYIYILCTVMIHDAILLYCRKRFHAQSLFLAHLIFILITECSTSYIHSLFNHICIYSIVYIYISYITYCLSLYIYTYPYMCIYANILYHAIHSIF